MYTDKRKVNNIQN